MQVVLDISKKSIASQEDESKHFAWYAKKCNALESCNRLSSCNFYASLYFHWIKFMYKVDVMFYIFYFIKRIKKIMVQPKFFVISDK